MGKDFKLPHETFHTPGRGGLFLEVHILVGHSKINGSLIRNLSSGSDKALFPLKVALIYCYIV